jgi:hypothetical protein
MIEKGVFGSCSPAGEFFGGGYCLFSGRGRGEEGEGGGEI